LDTSKCVGQGFDGAASLSSKRVGAAAEFQKIAAPFAEYYHCMMHSFNLCASDGVSTQFARNCMDNVRELATFFNTSAKRHQLLEESVPKGDNGRQSVTSLKQLCNTRFVERHDAILTALDLLPAVHKALDTMTDWDSRESRVAANNLLSAISRFDFIITLQALSKLSALLINVSRSLQQPGIDIMKALDDIRLVEKTLSRLRTNIDVEFATIYNAACVLANQLNITVSKPRVRAGGRSAYRPNSGDSDSSVEVYYRINMFAPLLDDHMAHIKERFGDTQRKCLSLTHLIPAYLGRYDEIKEAVIYYASFISSPAQVEGEFMLWREKWSDNDVASTVKTATSALQNCSVTSLPNIYNLLTILATLPVTTAEAERVFSKVERIVTAARAHMTEERLESLVMLSAHRDLAPAVGDIITRFSNTTARRLNFLL
jgi:hypothetical protein